MLAVMSHQLHVTLSVIIPPYTIMAWILSLLCVCLYGLDLSAVEKDNGVNFAAKLICMLVRLVSRMTFSHFGELWPRGGSPEA